MEDLGGDSIFFHILLHLARFCSGKKGYLCITDEIERQIFLCYTRLQLRLTPRVVALFDENSILARCVLQN